MAEQAAADPAAQYSQCHTRSHDPGNMADPSGRDTSGDISGQQIGRYGDKAEQGRSDDKCCEASGQRHRQHGEKLSGDKYGHELAVVDPVTKRQQQ